jgi:hypothetical protein
MGQCSATISSAPMATDNCAGLITGMTTDPLTYTTQGMFIVTWHYNDGHGNASSQSQTVIVDDTIAPVPNVATLPTVTGQCSASISSAPTATDNCAGLITGTTPDPLTYTTQGTFIVTWHYNDGHGNMTTQTQQIIVQDTTAPTVSCSVAQSALPTLWPPNHNLVNVGLSVSATDNCDTTPTITVMVFGDEDDEEPTGDGTHSPDAKDIAPSTLRLRSERKGDADGRVYLIVVKATDDAGNVGVACCTVVVPLSQSQADKNAVDAQAAAARSHCLANNGAPPPGYFVIGDGPIIGPRQ